MAKKNSSSTEWLKILKDAASIWRFLVENAGVDTIFYDPELLTGNDIEEGLYRRLGIRKLGTDFAEDLEVQNVPAEKFLMAFFQVLQPYAQMMSGLCAFFERHEVRGTAKSMRIQFDFSAVDEGELEFNLDHFRETISSFEKVKRLVQYFTLSSNDFWNFLRVFSDHYAIELAKPEIAEWVEKYPAGLSDWRQIALPVMGIAGLDEQLSRAFNIWRSFVMACEEIDLQPDFRDFHDRVSAYREETDPTVNGWNKIDLVHAMSDYWPASFVRKMFWRIEQIDRLAETDRQAAAAVLESDLRNYLDAHTIAHTEEQDLLGQLIDLLNLPIWQQRYELYSAWILALMDEVMAGYPGYVIHAEDGLIKFAFRATHLATFETVDGKVALWGERRMPADKPSGHGRKANVQPDYNFLKGENAPPVNQDSLAVVEVKQYRTPNAKNFREALNDYAGSMPNAHVFLVNYGEVPAGMDLIYSDRCTPLGQILPKSTESASFLDQLKAVLPPAPSPPPPTLNELVGFNELEWILLYQGFQKIYVDISGSLNTENYREFVATVVKWSISGGNVGALIAIDQVERQVWPQPVAEDVDELLALPFDGATDFADLLGWGDVLVITDLDGIKILGQMPVDDNRLIIHYTEGEPPRLGTLSELIA